MTEHPPAPANHGPALPLGSEPFRSPAELIERDREVMIIIGTTLLAILFAVFLGVFGYRFDQAPHRLFKVIAAGVFVVVVLSRPTWIPYFLCLAFPYSTWLPKSPIPLLNATTILTIGALLGITLLSLQRKVRPVVGSALNAPVAALVGWLIFTWIYGSFFWSERRFGALDSAKMFWSSISGLMIYFVVTHLIPDRKHLWRTVGWLMLGSALGVVGPIYESIADGFGTRTPGGIGDINRMGAFLAFAAVFSIGMLPAYRRLKKFLVALGGLVPAVGMIMPNSRGAYIGFLFAAIPQAMRTSVGGTLVVVTILGSSPLWAPDFVRERVRSTWDAATSEDRGAALDADSGGRITVWKEIGQVIAEHPVVGVGYGNLMEATRLVAGYYKHAHNLYLETAGEGGLIGLGILIWVFVSCWRLGGRLVRRRRRTAVLGRAYQGVVFCLLIANFFGQRFFDFGLSGFFFLLSALVALEERFTRAEPLGEGES
jgi:O-antigen ligase